MPSSRSWRSLGEAHNVGLSPPIYLPCWRSKNIGEVFKEFDSDSAAMIVLEGDQAAWCRCPSVLRHG